MHDMEDILGSIRNDTLVCAAVKGWSLLLSLLPLRVVPAVLTRCVDSVVLITMHITECGEREREIQC